MNEIIYSLTFGFRLLATYALSFLLVKAKG